LKKLFYLSKIFQNVSTNSPQLKKLSIVALIGAVIVFGFVAVLAIVIVIALFQFFSNSSISLDINQLFSQINTWIGGLFSAGQDAVENAPVQIQVNPSQ